MSGEQSQVKEKIGRLVQTAWEIKPAETSVYINHVVKDFPELINSSAYQLLLYTAPPAQSSKLVWAERAKLLHNLMSVMYSEGELPVFAGYYEVLKNETNTVKKEAIKKYLFLWQTRLSSSLYQYFHYYEDEVQAESYYRQAAALLDHFKKPEFAYWQAEAERYNIEYHLKKGQPQQAKRFYRRIKNIQEAYIDSDLAWVQAKAALRLLENAIGKDIYYTKGDTSAENHEAARQYYEQIETLHKEFQDLVIALVQANAAHQLSVHCMSLEMEEQAKYYANRITALNKKYHNYELAMEEYKLVRELIRHNRRANIGEEKRERDWKYYDRMFDLEKLLKTF